MKKPLLIAAGIFVLLASIATAVVVFRSSSETPVDEKPAKKRISEPVNVIPREERPAITITPSSDAHYITINLLKLNKEASYGEYEVEYQTGSLLQGAEGPLDVTAVPFSDTMLLGSKSAGGSTTYHEEVSRGKLLARFEGPENYAVKTEWKFIENTENETAFSSPDAKFQISSEDLESQKVMIIGDSSGLPEGYEGTLVSQPYFISAARALSGSATVSIRAEETGELTLIGWDGSKWNDLDSTVEDKVVTAEDVAFYEIFAVVSR